MARLNRKHKTETDYRQRMTTEDWKEVLLRKEEVIVFNNEKITLAVKDLGYGVVEVYKINYKVYTEKD